MKRSVIQIANSTQLISLPRKWSQKYGVKKGDEIEVEEQGNKILLSTEQSSELKRIDIDVSGLDRTTIIYYLQILYRLGFDELKISFNTPVTTYFRTHENVNIITVINQEVSRLIGYEIIQHKENFCIVKDISTNSIKEFDNVLRRIFLLLSDASNDLIKGVKEKNWPIIETIEEKHDSITKFISYCSRLLNKYGYPDHKKTIVLYNILASMDREIDVIKNAGRDVLKLRRGFNGKTVQLMELVDDTIKLFSEFFYKYDIKNAVVMYKNRNDMLELLYQYKNKIPTEELIIVSKMEHIFELLTVMQVSRMGMEYQ